MNLNMEENFEKVVELLKKQNQEQILEYPINNKEEFAQEVLKINFEQLKDLYDKAIKDEKMSIKGLLLPHNGEVISMCEKGVFLLWMLMELII